MSKVAETKSVTYFGYLPRDIVSLLFKYLNNFDLVKYHRALGDDARAHAADLALGRQYITFFSTIIWNEDPDMTRGCIKLTLRKGSISMITNIFKINKPTSIYRRIINYMSQQLFQIDTRYNYYKFLCNILKIDYKRWGITELPPMPNATHINCSYNSIQELESYPSCVVMDCSFNHIKRIRGLKSCEDLNCRHNELSYLPRMPRCLRLFMSFNNIREWPIVKKNAIVECEGNKDLPIYTDGLC
jgi:hypothetical protein